MRCWPNNTSQGTRISGRHVFRRRAVRALERERYASLGQPTMHQVK